MRCATDRPPTSASRRSKRSGPGTRPASTSPSGIACRKRSSALSSTVTTSSPFISSRSCTPSPRRCCRKATQCTATGTPSTLPSRGPGRSGRSRADVAALLRVSDLRTHYVGFGGTRVVKAVDGVSFSVEAGETFGLVGESGCGKTTMCHTIVRLLPPSARIVSGSIELEGEDLVKKSQSDMRLIRGRRIATILQDPMASLDPLFSIYDQVAEPAYYHQSLRGRALRRRVTDLLAAVRIPSPERRMRDFPHQLSGGMRQRIVGAIAQAGAPRVIVADEPTTNLDVTIQLQYLNLLKDLQRATGVALIFVTHNLGIVAKMCDKVAVMYAGKIVEQQSVRDLFYTPRHPYTKALLDSMPKLGSKEPLYAIPGQPPDPSALPPGCSFHPRCAYVLERCCTEEPWEQSLSDGRMVQCWRPWRSSNVTEPLLEVRDLKKHFA